MRIAMIGQKGVPARFGGVETHVAELGSRLAALNHEVLVYARAWYTDTNIVKYDGMHVIHVPSLRTKHFDAISHTFLSVMHAIFVARPDVYHFHGVGPSLLAFLPRVLQPSAKVIATFHCVDRKHEKWGWFARTMLWLGEWCAVKIPHETIAVGKELAKYIEAEYGVTPNYIPNGITPRRAVMDQNVIAPFGLEPFSYILMVSRLVKHKGAHTLINAWQAARAARPDLFASLKLAIAGDSAFTDDYVYQLKEMAAGDDSIVFTGYQRGDTLEGLFMGARFVVHPSVSEGMPIAVLEAMSYGKGVLASDIPEHLELTKDNGFSFHAGNEADLAAKITDLVDDPMRAAALGHVARSFVEEEYNWSTIAAATELLYERVQTLPDLVRVAA